MCSVKKEIGGPSMPHDAHNAASCGAARHLNCAINPNRTYTLCAVFVVVNTSAGSTCTA